MKRYSTVFSAIDKTDGSIKTFAGNDVYSYSKEDAEVYCEKYFPHLTITGEHEEDVNENDLLKLRSN